MSEVPIMCAAEDGAALGFTGTCAGEPRCPLPLAGLGASEGS